VCVCFVLCPRSVCVLCFFAGFKQDSPGFLGPSWLSPTRLVSQCVSSSGCERNWSTFSLLHTKVRNCLTHKKLNKLVHVNYRQSLCELQPLPET
jgi:hypothetical protein